MKINSVLGVVLLSLAFSVQALAQLSPDATLDALHKAGVDADEAKFVSFLASDVVLLGVAGGSRLEGQSVRDFVSQSFANGVTWAFRSSQRETRLSADGSVAWFDESLQHEQLGHGRGTGVLIRDSAGWKIAQYNLTVPLSGGQGVRASEAAAGLVPQDNASSSSAAPKKKQCWKTSHKTNMQAKC